MQDWVFDLIEAGGYLGIFFLMLLETVFPPIPSEVIMPVAGVSAATGSLTLGGVIGSGTAGAMVGNFIWYLLARAIGINRFQPFITKFGRWLTIDWPDVERAHTVFGRFGAIIVCAGRIIPTIRSVISIPAGLLRMHLIAFLFWSTLGTVAWSSGLAIAGWWLGQRFADVEAVVGPLSMGIMVFIALVYVWRQATWHRRRSAA